MGDEFRPRLLNNPQRVMEGKWRDGRVISIKKVEFIFILFFVSNESKLVSISRCEIYGR